MAWYNIFGRNKQNTLNEEIKAFINKGEKFDTPKQISRKSGEGIEDIHLVQGFGNIGLGSFNLFYDRYINIILENEIARIKEYRSMSNMSEISDVIEDAVNECTQEDEEGETVRLIIKDQKLKEMKILQPILQIFSTNYSMKI